VGGEIVQMEHLSGGNPLFILLVLIEVINFATISNSLLPRFFSLFRHTVFQKYIHNRKYIILIKKRAKKSRKTN
jgi:hypothetical protein